MQTRFHENLDQLATQLHAMCLHDRTTLATALLRANLESTEQAIDMRRELDTMRDDCGHAAVTLVALQAPVASELRQVVTAIRPRATVGGLLGGHDRCTSAWTWCGRNQRTSRRIRAWCRPCRRGRQHLQWQGRWRQRGPASRLRGGAAGAARGSCRRAM
ncbi:hypothetical protein ACLMAL_34630 [Nocardia sp. CWNU-33]|uniref:hypothetical protein n=1 Tax=Nocardia sp. CWNU-33 TaxID=3392117 RepID=UPI00398E7CEC